MIARIRSMRTFTKKSRFQADSLPEIRHGLDQLAFDLKDERVGNRTISEGHVANAAILVLMAMPEKERYAMVLEGFRKLNELLAIEDPVAESEAVNEILNRPVVHQSRNPGEGPGLKGANDLGDGIRIVDHPSPKRRKRPG